MEFKLFIKCIFDRSEAVDIKFFEKISKSIGIDIYTLKQKFIGKGWAVLKRSEDKNDLIGIKQKLNELNIKNVILSDDEIYSQKIFEVSMVQEYNDNFKFISGKEEIVISKKETIFFVGGIDKKKLENVNLKKLLLEKNFVYYLYSSQQDILLKFEHEKVNYTNIKNFSKYSKSENFLKFYDTLKNFSNGFTEDINYSENYVEEIFFDLKTYSVISSLLFKKGLYSFFYNQNLIDKSKTKVTDNLVYDFKYNIYRPKEIIFKKNRINTNRLNLMEIFFIPFGVILFGFLILFRVGKINIFPYILLVSIIYYSYNFIKIFKLKVFLQSIPFSKIESISVGVHEIKGFIVDDYAIPSPISGTKCVYFQYKKYRKVKDSEGKTKWQLDHIGEYLPSKFIIQDEQGNRITVKTEKITFNLKNKTVYTKTFFKFFSLEDSTEVKYEEEILPVMSEVFVVGSVVSKDYEKEKNDYIKNKKQDKNYMNNFDLNGDNIIDGDEWENAKANIESEFNRDLNKRKENENLEVVYSKDDKILFVSDVSERTFLKYSNIFLLSSIIVIIIFITLIFHFGGL